MKEGDVWKMMLLKLIIEVFREKEIIIALHLHHAKKMRVHLDISSSSFRKQPHRSACLIFNLVVIQTIRWVFTS